MSDIEIRPYKLMHSMTSKLEKTTVALLTQVLEDEADIHDGLFLITPQEQVGMKGNDRWRYVRYENGQLYLRLKPGDNSTAWIWIIKPPTDAIGQLIAHRLSGGKQGEDPEADDTEQTQHTAEAAEAPPRDTEADGTQPSTQFNPVAEPTANGKHSPEPATPLPAGTTIAERYEIAKKQAAAYHERELKITQLRKQADELILQAEKVEKEINKLREEADKDVVGKTANEKLRMIQQLLEA